MSEYNIKVILESQASFRLLEQLILPLIWGGIGGFIRILMKTMDEDMILGRITKKNKNDNVEAITGYPKLRRRLIPKFTFIGSIAGFAAVALLNPNGDISQVSVLALLAGLSGISYLSRNALVDGNSESDLLDKKKKESEKIDIFKDYEDDEISLLLGEGINDTKPTLQEEQTDNSDVNEQDNSNETSEKQSEKKEKES